MRKKYENELNELLELRRKSEIRSTDPEVIKESKNAKREYEKRLYEKYGLMGPNVLKQIQNVLELKENILKEADEIDDRTIELTFEQEKIEKEIADFDEIQKKIEDLEKRFHDLIEKEVEIQSKLKTVTSEDERNSLMEELDKVGKEKQDNNTKAIELNNKNEDDKKTHLIEKKNELQTQIDKNNKESNELKNKAARCDLVATCLIRGIEWDKIKESLKNYQDREFTCKDRKLYNKIKALNGSKEKEAAKITEKDDNKFETKDDFIEYNRRVLERIESHKIVNGKEPTDGERKQIRNQVSKDMEKEKAEKEAAEKEAAEKEAAEKEAAEKEKVRIISEKLDKDADKVIKSAKEELIKAETAKEEKTKTASEKTETTVPKELGKKGEYKALKDDLLKDIKEKSKDAAKSEKTETTDPKESSEKNEDKSEKKIGIFDAIKGWFNKLFNKNKTKKLKEAAETAEKETSEKAEKEAAEKAEKEAAEKAEKEAAEKAEKEAAEKTAKEAAEKTAKEVTEKAEKRKQNAFKNMYRTENFDGIIENVAKKGMDGAVKEFSDEKMKKAKEAAINRDVQNEAKRLRIKDEKNGQLKYKVTSTGNKKIDKKYYENKAKETYGDEER